MAIEIKEGMKVNDGIYFLLEGFFKVVYKGGNHKVVCQNGEHFCVPKSGKVWKQGKCWCKK